VCLFYGHIVLFDYETKIIKRNETTKFFGGYFLIIY
jgi:hypothetical protein